MENILDNKHLKQSPFDVPDNYFEQFSVDILTKTTSHKVVRLHNRRKVITYLIAASFVLAISLSWIINYYNVNTKQDYFAVAIQNQIYDYDMSLIEDYSIGDENQTDSYDYLSSSITESDIINSVNQE